MRPHEGMHEELRTTVRAFVEREYLPREREFVEARGFDTRLWEAAGRAGVLGINIPAEYLGAGVDDYRYAAVAIEELARAGVALASCLSVHFDVVVPYFVKFGTDVQRQQWLPELATGRAVAGIAMTEPSAGSDLAGILSVARRTGHGTWVLRGSKTFITNGGSADVFIVAARTGERRKDISLFVVPADRGGFIRGRLLDKVGLPQADTSELAFDDVVLTSDDLLGEVDGGFEMMREQLVQERLGSAVANLSNTSAVLAETVEYVRQRQVFGRELAKFQVPKHSLALQTARVEVLRAYVDQCVREHIDEQLTDTAAAIAKWQTAEVQNCVIDACLQLHGGYGYMKEYRVGRAWMDARVSRIWAGTSEIMAEIVGNSVVN